MATGRCGGSGGYRNPRTGHFFTLMQSKLQSVAKCARVFEEAMRLDNADCPLRQAQAFITHKLDLINSKEWAFRPGNMQNFYHCMISDVFHALNYHGGCMQGAENGVGGVMWWSDGGGTQTVFNRLHNRSWTLHQVLDKDKGCGADFVVNHFTHSVKIKNFDPNAPVAASDVFVEVKQSSGFGLLQDFSDITEEKPGHEPTIVYQVRETHKLMYTTELIPNPNNLQALAWAIDRNTVGGNANILRTTRADDATGRVKVTYTLVKGGYFALCSNNVQPGPCAERVRAICSVARQVSSCTNAMDETRSSHTQNKRVITNGQQNYMSRDFVQPADLIKLKETLFYTSYGVMLGTAMTQWIGMGGSLIRSSDISEAIYNIFLVQLDLSRDILSPTKSSAGEIGRACQVSKARGVAHSLLCGAVQQTIDSGRQGMFALCLSSHKLLIKLGFGSGRQVHGTCVRDPHAPHHVPEYTTLHDRQRHRRHPAPHDSDRLYNCHAALVHSAQCSISQSRYRL